MIRSSRHARPHLLAIVASLVLALGLPRLFVHCTDVDGVARVEFVHGGGKCHHEAGLPHPAHACATADSDEAPSLRPDRRCKDVSFVVDLAPPERPHGVSCGPPAIGWVACEDAAIAAGNDTVRRPPSPGPPRTDRRAGLRATTLLLL